MFELGAAVVPHSLDCEQAAIGCALLDARAAAILAADASPEMFWTPRLRAIAESVVRLVREGATVDLVTVKNDLDARGQLALAGGVEHLYELVQFVPSSAGIARHIRGLRDLALTRQIHQVGRELQEAALADGVSPEQRLSDAIQALSVPLGTGGRVISGASAAQAAHQLMAEMQAERDLQSVHQWCWHGLQVAGPLRQGHLVIVAARPGQDKTIVLAQQAIAAARRGQGVLFLTLEMEPQEIALRMAGHLGRLTDRGRGADELCWLPNLRIMDATGMSAQQIRAKVIAEQMSQGGGLGMVCVDYFGMLRFGGGPDKWQAMSDAVDCLKKAARDARVPVMLAAQINRDGGAKARPGLEDLKGTGQLEQSADQVVLLHQERLSGRTMVEMACAKARYGRPVMVYTQLEGGHTLRELSETEVEDWRETVKAARRGE